MAQFVEKVFFDKLVRLSRKVEDAVFFDRQVYEGTPREKKQQKA